MILYFIQRNIKIQGFFQFFMPVIGWYIGIQLAEMIQSVDHWIAFFLLAFAGSGMDIVEFGTKSRITTQS
ncbi:MAG TPA: hypothetical protein ENH29_05125 [Bacteroidetes bacterium]|nr:hypothetical protein [Bacteroidota bacterium]